MALLSIEKRKSYFQKLGLGEYYQANILKLQKKYMLRKSDWDGIYGPNTDTLLRHLVNCRHVANFEPEEFVCGCGGKYCSGYPDRMKVRELRHLQSIRTHFGKPVEITSGLRCKQYNASLSNSSATSPHMIGKAADIYIKGVSDTFEGRKKIVNYAKEQKGHSYSYCNGYDSNGNAVNSPKMGKAVHTAVK